METGSKPENITIAQPKQVIEPTASQKVTAVAFPEVQFSYSPDYGGSLSGNVLKVESCSGYFNLGGYSGSVNVNQSNSSDNPTITLILSFRPRNLDEAALAAGLLKGYLSRIEKDVNKLIAKSAPKKATKR